MRLKTPNKLRLVRPSDGFLPAALLLCAALGRSGAAQTLFIHLFLARMFALASAPGLRQAFAVQPSLRKARGSVRAGLLLQAVGAALLLLMKLAVHSGSLDAPAALGIAAGMFLNIEHVFYEYLYAANEPHSAMLCRFITAALTLTGVMLCSASAPEIANGYWTSGAALLSATVAAVIALSIGGPLKDRLNTQVLKTAPLSMAQCALYPFMWLLLRRVPSLSAWTGATAAPFFAGLIVMELCRTPFRRSFMESKPFNRALTAVAASGAALLLLILLTPIKNALAGEIPAAGAMLLLACCCAFALYGHIEITYPRKNPKTPD